MSTRKPQWATYYRGDLVAICEKLAAESVQLPIVDSFACVLFLPNAPPTTPVEGDPLRALAHNIGGGHSLSRRYIIIASPLNVRRQQPRRRPAKTYQFAWASTLS